MDDYIAQMAKDMPDTQIMLTGFAVLQPDRNLPAEIRTIPDFQTLIDIATA
jgi:hypothetical protein